MSPLEVSGFLEGFDIPDAREFALWKDRQQARLLPYIANALTLLIDQCRRTGDSKQIEALADRMLALDELSEEAIRAKMEARAMAGDRLTALQIYEEWKEKLSEELAALPSERVERIATRLRRRGWERSATSNVPTAPVDHWRDRPFVGRTTEYRVLYEAWEASRARAPRHVLVLGDSGIGKTTLVTRFMTAAQLEGAAVTRVQCYDLEREIPYAALGNLLHGLLDRPGVAASAPEALAELSRIVPELRRRFPSIPAVEESQGETTRIRLTEAALDLLTSVAEDQPVILVIDDLHFADDASLGALHLILRRSHGSPVMALMTARPDEPVRSPQIDRLREAADRLALSEVDLPPLTEDESRALLSSLMPAGCSQPSASVRRALLRAGNGFPMALELLAQDWLKNGDTSLVLSLSAMTAEVSVGSAPSTLLRHALERAVKSLDLPTRHVLHLAAILGHRLNDIHLYSIADLTIGSTMSGLSHLTSTRILRDNGQGLEFANELLRTAAYLAIPSPLRRVLHSSLADWFIEETGKGARALGLEVAWHCLRAGRDQEASAYLLQGAKEAMDNGALDAAERALSTALPHLAQSDRERAALLLAEVLQDQGRWRESAQVLAEHAAGSKAELAVVLTILAEHRTHRSNPERIRSDVRSLTSIAICSSDPFLCRRAIRAAARLMPDIRDEALANEVLAVLDNIMACEDTSELSLEIGRAQLLYYAGQHRASLEQLTECLARCAASRIINSSVGDIYVGLGVIGCFEGRYEEAATNFREAYRVFARIGNEAAQSSIAAQIALCCGRMGEYCDQILWSRKASLTSPIGPYNLLQFAYYEAFALAMRGEHQASIDRMAAVDSEAGSFESPWLVQAWRLAKADIKYLCGQQAAGIETAKEAIHYPRPVLHATSFAGAYARWLAVIVTWEGGFDEARQEIAALYRQLSTYDALDQVEILCAYALCGSGSDHGFQRSPELASRLSRLPRAVAEQLRRLGLSGVLA